jgi:hypothetical protein
MLSTPRTRWVNFLYTSDYWYILAAVSEYLEEQGLISNEDFIWRDNGHTLEIDQDAYWNIKEDPEWQRLLEAYERVGNLRVRNL